MFDHERLDVYRLSIDYVANSFTIARDLNGLRRHARDQWLRAAQSIPKKIADDNGKRSRKDRSRFLDIARGSTLECASIQDVLAATDGIAERLIGRAGVVSELSEEYNAVIEYEYHDAEYEYEEQPEPWIEPEVARARLQMDPSFGDPG